MDEFPITTLVAGLAFLAGIVMGATARWAQFCTLGAIADAFLGANHIRLRSWALAIATALLAAQAMHVAGVVDLYGSIYLTPDFGWLGAIVGGLCFGFGMALVGTCSFGSLIRLGGGDLRSLVNFMVLGIVAYMTMRGLTGLGRVLVIEPTNLDLTALGGQGLIDAAAWMLGTNAAALRGPSTALIIAGLGVYCFSDPAFRRSRRDLLAGLIIGLTVASGWVITGVVGADEFEPTPLASFSFARPAGESLVYLMTFTGTTINFGIATVGGVIVGAFLVAAAKRQLRLEAFDDGREMRRHLIGAALMGFGGVTALGCTIGQGITGLSTLSMGALLALAAIFLGAYLGLRYLVEGSLLHALHSVIARH